MNLSIERKGWRHPNLMRPFIAKDGNGYVMNQAGKPQLVNNATLQYDEWRMLDDAVVEVARQRQTGIQDLRDYGLVKPLANPMATTVLTYQRISDAMEASVSISPKKRAAGDRVDYETAHLPIPIIHSDFDIEDRVLQESQMRGNGLDTEGAFAAAQAVSFKMIDMLFGATSLLTYGGGTIYTYLTEPNRNTQTLSQNWDASGKTGAEILTDILTAKQTLINDRYYGPYVVYIPTAYETVLDEDYDVSGSSLKTIRQRILDIENVDRITVVDRLPANTVLVVCMNRNVVDLVDGMPLQTVQWTSPDSFNHSYKVMAIQIPRVKSDYGDRSGIVHIS
jgi:hypothetical protein